MWNNSHRAALASRFLALDTPHWQGSAQHLCGVHWCLSSTTTFSTRKIQFSRCLTVSTYVTTESYLSKLLFSQGKILFPLLLTSKHLCLFTIVFYRKLRPSFMPSLRWCLSQCSSIRNLNVNFFLGEISIWCCTSQGNSIAALVLSMLICFQNFFHFLIWFLSTLWAWNPPGKGVSESLQFSLLSCIALLALCAEKVRQI